MKFGSTDISDVKFGSTQITAVKFGSTDVWAQESDEPTRIVYHTFSGGYSPSSIANADTGQATVAARGTWGTATGTARLFTADGSNNLAYWESGESDCTVQCKLTVIRTYQGLALRCVDASNYLCVLRNKEGGLILLMKSVSGTLSSIQNASASISDGDTLKAVLNGSSIKVYVNSTEVISVTDTTYSTATKHGIVTDNLNCEFDDFEVWTL